MSLPTVVIVGRPNVGKSTLFNALAGRRISIEEPTSGVTRDRISTILTSVDGARLELVDTGGMGLTAGAFATRVAQQIRQAIEHADILVLVVDGKAGIVPRDREIAARMHAVNKPLVLVANKLESTRDTATAAEFHALGLGEPMPVSALHRKHTGALRDRLFALAAEIAGEMPAVPEIRIAVVGQRNVGKSTFINALAREERVIVSEIPGTTRDSIDVRIEREGKALVVIDTAGIRKKAKMSDAIEFFSRVRAEESIRRADVVLLMIDPQAKVSQVDKRLAGYVIGHYKPCVIVVNKWDLAKDVPTAEFAEYLGKRLPGLSYAPICFVSALKGRGVQRAVDLAETLWKQAHQRVATAGLNAAIELVKTRPQTDGMSARRPKIYYATQVGTAPPAIVLFVNDPDSFSTAYRRFIAAFLRTHLPFAEVPIVVRYKKASGRGERP